MSITREEIEHVAALARLSLSETEKVSLANQLGAVLSYIDQLQVVDTSGVEPTAQVSGLTDVWRTDEVKSWDEEELGVALSQGDREGHYIKVKKVL